MLLAVDIGNSSISLGVFDLPDCATKDSVSESALVHRFKISAKGLSADEYAMEMFQFLKLRNIHPAPNSQFGKFSSAEQQSVDQTSCPVVNHAVIASVVPTMTDVIAKAVSCLTGELPLVIGAGVRTGVGIRIKNPEQLGADIVANAAYAVELAPAPLVILDVGTATTLTIIDKDKDILGTIIMPGLRISLEALSQSAALLNDISLTATNVLIGRDSAESVRSGVVNGHILMIDGFLRNLREYFRENSPAADATAKLSLISTGGLASLILPHMRNKFTNIESLTLLGAAKIFCLNSDKLSAK